MELDLSSQRSFDLDAPQAPARGGCTIKRFTGTPGRPSEWDGLHKDSQLWYDNGDCTVRFYAYRASKRGPSLKIPFQAVEELKSSHLSIECLHRRESSSSTDSSDETQSDSGYASSQSYGSDLQRTPYELYIPAPPNLTREEAFAYHLTTRNVLAYAVGAPVVGPMLGAALIQLWDRLVEWQPINLSREAFLQYCDGQKYLDFAGNSEHAMAFLRFSEELQLRELWIDAFSHCVGMHDRIDCDGSEFRELSKTSIALLSRATLEIELHVSRIGRALSSFLEQELGTENLGLSTPARDHLEHFRSFLQRFYMHKHGYFPPHESSLWDKDLWSEMQLDFQGLYDYLVDVEASSDRSGNRGVTGGTCVVQNVQAFDLRHGYTPLQHPLPLLPCAPTRRRSNTTNSQKALRTLKLEKSNSMNEITTTSRQALVRATNGLSCKGMDRTLVQEYRGFERHGVDNKLDIVEARKVRWLLIYGVLQMLNSLMSAPPEVQDIRTPTYPLCVLTTDCPPWDDAEILAARTGSVESAVESNPSSLVPQALDDLKGRSSRISIHPDCEADNAEDYFSRSGSQVNMSMAPAPLRLSTPASRSASFRSSFHALHSKVGSITRQNGGLLENKPRAPKKSSSCDVVVEHFNNDLEYDGEFHDPNDVRDALRNGANTNPLHQFDFGFAPVTHHEPTLDFSQLELDQAPHNSPPSLTPSPTPHRAKYHSWTSTPTHSNRSSSYLDDCESPVTDITSCDGSSFRRTSAASASSFMLDPQTPDDPAATCDHSSATTPKASASPVPVKAPARNVNAGTYVPSGMRGPTRSSFAVAVAQKFSRQREQSPGSDGSSVYAAEPVQASDIEEEETRGRRRSRLMDTKAFFGMD